MQEDEQDILGALTYLLRSVKETNQLSAKPIDHWPTYAATLQKISEEDGERVYQGKLLKQFSQAKIYFENHYAESAQVWQHALVKGCPDLIWNYPVTSSYRMQEAPNESQHQEDINSKVT